MHSLVFCFLFSNLVWSCCVLLRLFDLVLADVDVLMSGLFFHRSVTSALSAASIALASTMAGVFPPGSYSSGAAVAINTPVQLDCQGQSTSSFFFTIGGALSINADVSLINGACSVSWSVAGAATIAAGISLTGSVSATGAIALGAGSSISGSAQSSGAVTLGSGASVGSVSSSISPSR
jgi:hypothetical protein